MRTDNQAKKKGLESKLDLFLDRSLNEGSVIVANGRIQRSWIIENIGCGQNWLSQNEYAKNKIAKAEKKLL